MTLGWMIGVDDNWCELQSLDFDSECFANNLSGVYIVWYGPDEAGHEGRVVCIGHGVIRAKLAALRDAPTLLRYSGHRLLVTWAEVDREHQVSVEAYLAVNLEPDLGDRHLHSVQTIVNVPQW